VTFIGGVMAVHSFMHFLKLSEAVFPRESANFAAISAIAKE
jgi:hypothetical protein